MRNKKDKINISSAKTLKVKNQKDKENIPPGKALKRKRRFPVETLGIKNQENKESIPSDKVLKIENQEDQSMKVSVRILVEFSVADLII